MSSIIPRAREYLGWCPHTTGFQGRMVSRKADGREMAVAPGISPAGPGPVKDSVHYRHTQFGRVQIWASIAAILIIALSMVFIGPYWISIASVFILGDVATIILFGSLTVMVSREELLIRFGAFGIVNRAVPLATISGIRVIETPGYYGWGALWTPEGRLYNISGTTGVEVTLCDGTKFRVGTDEPEALAESLHARLSPLAEGH
ncbi:MAG: hypothetical protein GX651_03915 [Methanomicrobiales archaeon]|nr:hypothetical protein [Methanomicrobiales archaeon]